MKTRIITFLSVVVVVLIFMAQAYVVFENYKITRNFLTRESDAILETAFRQDLKLRNKVFQRSLGAKAMIVPPPPTAKNTIRVDMGKMNDLGNNTLGAIDLGINYVISSKAPMHVKQLDSITGVILKDRNIISAFSVNIVETRTNKIIEQSGIKSQQAILIIKSKLLLVDKQREKSLQLILINPFASIFKHMGLLLFSSFLLSLFCFYGLWFLFNTLARQKKLMEVKNDFFGNTAHELKCPVAQLHLALEALSKPEILDNIAKRERYLAISTEATRDMSEKITMIMTLSMAEEGVFKLNYSHFNLLEEVQKLKEQFSVVAGKDVEIRIEKKEEDFNINADRDHIRQCLANLLDNAIKYSGNSVLISITLQRLKDSLQVSVKDNGIGIETDKQDKVFEKYTRLNSESGSPTGFGIGLSYVKAVVEKHSGKIELKSEQTIGSEFILYLPV